MRKVKILILADMGQLLLPIFPSDTRMINMTLGVREYDGTVFYLHSGVPIFSHSSDDLTRFRFITSNLILQGRCTNQEIADTFHVSTDSVRRWKKKFSEEGDVAFFKEESRHGRSHKLLPVVLARIQGQLDLHRSCYSIAKEEGISEGSIRYAISLGRLKKNFGAEINTATTRSQRSIEDARAAEGIGIAATREEERGLAVTGKQDYATSLFEHHESVFNAGVLFALPALISQGLERFFKVFNPLPPGFYGLHHVILILCFMALCRIKNPEQLKKHPPGELGKLLGLDRIPEVGYFRTKIKQITDQSKADELHMELFRSWAEEMPEMFFYIDGHVRVYHGEMANLPKRFVSREKLCLSGTTEFWVNDQQGLPLMVVTGELNEKLKTAIEEIIPKIKKEITLLAKPTEPAFTIVVDREVYEPAWFIKLWEQHRVAVITYRKNVKDKWDSSLFYNVEKQIYNTNVTMQLCEMGTQLNGHWFREIRKLSENGHQVSVLTTHPSLSLPETAVKMFSRWAQENFFKYMIADFDFDRMIEYGTEPVNQKSTIPNPHYKELTYQIKKAREKKARLEARIFQQMESKTTIGSNVLEQIILKSAELIEKINEYNQQIETLLAKRKNQPSRISIAEMPREQRYNKLLQESKKLKNAIIMLSYRAESALYNIMPEFYKSTQKEGRVILKEIFTSDADMMPDYQNNIITITLHSLSTPRANQAVKELCAFLNQTETCFPLTNLKLIYKTVAL